MNTAPPALTRTKIDLTSAERSALRVTQKAGYVVVLDFFPRGRTPIRPVKVAMRHTRDGAIAAADEAQARYWDVVRTRTLYMVGKLGQVIGQETI
jgi:hypothetical protein